MKRVRVNDDVRRKRAEANRFEFKQSELKKLLPRDKPYQVWDAGVRGQMGLSLLISPSGVKTYRSTFCLHDKHFSRKLGRLGEMELKWARERTQSDRKIAAQGRDPREARKVTKKSYETIVDEFIEKYAKRKQRTWLQTERALKRHCGKWLKRPIRSITTKEIEGLLEDLISDGRSRTAQLTLTWMRLMWKWASKKDLADKAVIEKVDVEFEPPKIRDKVFSDDEIRDIWKAANQLDPVKSAFVKLLILLAPRKNELAGMRRAELNDGDSPSHWQTPHERTKSKKTAAKKRTYETPLSALAARIVRGIPVSEHDPDLVFWGTKQGRPIDAGQPLKRLLVKNGAPSDFTFHAARHTLATWLQEQGRSEFEIALVLNHSPSGGSVTGGYMHGVMDDIKAQFLQQWADHVEGLVQPDRDVAVLR